jgi:RecB family endonuclease NucS
MLKGDGSILVHSDTGSYKPLNWMNPPCTITVQEPEPEAVEAGVIEVWRVSQTKTADILYVSIHEIIHELDHHLGEEPGLQKDGVEAHLQELLADQLQVFEEGATLIRREYSTAIGPVDILCKDSAGQTVAIEIKRRGEIDGVEQLTRYLDLLNRDPHLAPVRGVFAAQEIKPQARTLAEDRGIECLVLDYDAMRGLETNHSRLF